MPRILLISLSLAALGLGSTASAAGHDAIYPSQLLKQKPALAQQYRALIKPIVADHGWVRNGGTETPVSHIRIENKQYAVLSRCKPHACPEASLVSLMTPSEDHAVGALVTNSGDQGAGPRTSRIRWLGQPDNAQRRFMAAYLFR